MRSDERRKVVWGGSPMGMSLVEATVVLMVGAFLTAIVGPSIAAYVQDAQQTAAKRDTEAIGTALVRMLTDVGETFIVRDAAATSTTQALAHGAPSHSSNRVDMLVSDGNTPAIVSGFTRGSGTDWEAAVGTAAIQKLEYYLVLNTPSNDSAKKYRTATGMNGTLGFDPDGGAQFNSEHAWRGAYLAAPLGPDPWGNRYAVNVEFLERPIGAGPSGNVNDVFVLSAGNNARIETLFATDGVTSTNDIIYLVSGGTR